MEVNYQQINYMTLTMNFVSVYDMIRVSPYMLSISDDEINGEAFMDLDDSALDEMGFKRGQRMKILKIIESVKVCGIYRSDSLESVDDLIDHTMSFNRLAKILKRKLTAVHQVGLCMDKNNDYKQGARFTRPLLHLLCIIIYT